MADTVSVGGKSREEVALELMRLIAQNEGHKNQSMNGIPRDYALSTYLQCWDVVSGANPRK